MSLLLLVVWSWATQRKCSGSCLENEGFRLLKARSNLRASSRITITIRKVESQASLTNLNLHFKETPQVGEELEADCPGGFLTFHWALKFCLYTWEWNADILRRVAFPRVVSYTRIWKKPISDDHNTKVSFVLACVTCWAGHFTQSGSSIPHPNNRTCKVLLLSPFYR